MDFLYLNDRNGPNCYEVNSFVGTEEPQQCDFCYMRKGNGGLGENFIVHSEETFNQGLLRALILK